MSDAVFPNVGDLVARNVAAAVGFDGADLEVAPTRHLAVVACMDSRIDVFAVLGLANGEAHIVRNAGGVITDDVIRSLCLSQRKLGTREIILVHHTDCGLQKIDDDTFLAEVEADAGIRPTWSVESFSDPYADVRASLERIALSPFLPYKDHVSGFVYDVTDGLLHPC